MCATDLVLRRVESLAHAGIQTVDHQAYSLFTVQSTISRAFNRMEVEKIMWWAVITLSNSGILWHKVKLKRKMLPVCIPWRFLKLGTRLEWVVRLTLCRIYVWGKNPWYTSNTRLVAAWSQFWCQVNKRAIQYMTALCVIFARHFAHFPNAKCGKLRGGWG